MNVEFSNRVLYEVEEPRILDNLVTISWFTLMLSPFVLLRLPAQWLDHWGMAPLVAFGVAFITMCVLFVLESSGIIDSSLIKAYTREEAHFWLKGAVVARSATTANIQRPPDTVAVVNPDYEVSIEMEETGQVLHIDGPRAKAIYLITEAEGDKVAIEFEEKIGKNGCVLERNFLQIKRVV